MWPSVISTKPLANFTEPPVRELSVKSTSMEISIKIKPPSIAEIFKRRLSIWEGVKGVDGFVVEAAEYSIINAPTAETTVGNIIGSDCSFY